MARRRSRRYIRMMRRRGPVLFIVLDSADESVLHQLSAAGSLPVFSRLTQECVSGRVDTVPGVFVVGTWFSIATGMQPTRHRRCSWLRFDPACYAMRSADAVEMPYRTFWESVDRAGRRVCVVDFPHLPLLPLEHGSQVVDWYPHDRV
ncbi:MAG: hypothetical protein DWQ08_01575, partial [Proteobacteria bacterium]